MSEARSLSRHSFWIIVFLEFINRALVVSCRSHLLLLICFMGCIFGFSLFGLKLKHSRWFLKSHGLLPRLLHLDNGSIIHCWTPAPPPDPDESPSSSTKPALLLLHGFGADATIAWESQIACLVKRFALYMPDLLFFGESSTTNKQRSEFFQAECMWKTMQELGVQEAIVLGHSYGGFVAYRMASEYPEFVKRLVIVSSGICMNPRTNDPLLKKFGTTDIAEVLVPDSTENMRKGLKFVFNKLPWLPNFVYEDMFESMRGDREGKLELVDGIILGKENAPPLPKIKQEVFIIWGDQDQIFNIELAYQLKEFVGSKAELGIIKEAGHVLIIEDAKEFNRMLLDYLTRS